MSMLNYKKMLYKATNDIIKIIMSDDVNILFDIDNDDYYSYGDVLVSSIEINNSYDNIIPLEVTDSMVLLKCTIELTISGYSPVIQVWKIDTSSKKAKYPDDHVGMEFSNGKAQIECKIELLYNNKQPDQYNDIKVKKVTLLSEKIVDLDISDADTDEFDLMKEDNREYFYEKEE